MRAAVGGMCVAVCESLGRSEDLGSGSKTDLLGR